MNMAMRPVTLDDKYATNTGMAYITGIQALVRIALDRSRRDRKSGLNTGGFISGYRGSPLGGFDTELNRNPQLLEEHGIHFQPGVNEELGATAVMGSQKFDLVGQGGNYDGIFGIWYGKAPGVDRSGDALRQANISGTHRHGGVLALAGDDHLAKSSVLPQQSEYFFVHTEIPLFNPSDIQDVLDFGQHAFELSRYSGLWTAMICVSDTMDASAVVNLDPNRLKFRHPEMYDPRSNTDLNRGLYLKGRLEHEKIQREIRLPSVGHYVKANNLDGIRFGSSSPRLGIVATGKAYRDLRQALSLLGITEAMAKDIGLAIYKIAVSWPLEQTGIIELAKHTEKLLVVEHKRAFVEPQIKEILYHSDSGKRLPIWGKRTPTGENFLRDTLELTAEELVGALLQFLPEELTTQKMKDVEALIDRQQAWAGENHESAARIPYFCSGCPHSRSVKVPEGARSMPGIGCHAMSETAGLSSDGQIAMGNEGALWIGQAPFSKDKHIFVNIGDGTYFHSGILAIRQAVAANATMTYKILYNDAVAMTGGQLLDGKLTVPQLAKQLDAEGVRRIEILSERPHLYGGGPILGSQVKVRHRDELMEIQSELAEFQGVSAIIYDQTCATEKRRRRKRGEYENPGRRLFINERICEDCGDCSAQSNCLSIEPVETNFGRKRKINQSNCNMDFSCVKGFCPSFVWVEDVEFQRQEIDKTLLENLCNELSDARVADLDGTINLVIAGIGGMGVTTAAAILAMATHIDGNNASTLDMTGMAQKGGPVTSHVRFSASGVDIEGPRVPIAELDILVASDLLVAGNADSLSCINKDRTFIVANSKIAPTADFVMHQILPFDSARIQQTLKSSSRDSVFVDVAGIAESLLGDAIYTNLMLLGLAAQAGVLPVSTSAVENAIRLNGVSIELNLNAFRIGRILFENPDAIGKLLPQSEESVEMSLEERLNFLHNELAEYQNTSLANKFTELVNRVKIAENSNSSDPDSLARHVAENLYRVMAYKDEYEIARLYSDRAFKLRLQNQFANHGKLKVMLAPPFLNRLDAMTGRPEKREFGPWVFHMFNILKRFKFLRGTRFDPFGRTRERKAERELLQNYLIDIETILAQMETMPLDLLKDLAKLPSIVKGYGHIKHANLQIALNRRLEIQLELEKKLRHPDESEESVVLSAAE